MLSRANSSGFVTRAAFVGGLSSSMWTLASSRSRRSPVRFQPATRHLSAVSALLRRRRRLRLSALELVQKCQRCLELFRVGCDCASDSAFDLYRDRDFDLDRDLELGH